MSRPATAFVLLLAAAVPVLAGAGSSLGVSAPGLTVCVSPNGDVMARRIGPNGFVREVRLSSALTKCGPDGEVRVVAMETDVNVSQARVQAETGRRCVLTRRFSPTPNSIRWELEVLGDARRGLRQSTRECSGRLRAQPPSGPHGAAASLAAGVERPAGPVPFDDWNSTYGGVDFARPTGTPSPSRPCWTPKRHRTSFGGRPRTEPRHDADHDTRRGDRLLPRESRISAQSQVRVHNGPRGPPGGLAGGAGVDGRALPGLFRPTKSEGG